MGVSQKQRKKEAKNALLCYTQVLYIWAGSDEGGGKEEAEVDLKNWDLY